MEQNYVRAVLIPPILNVVQRYDSIYVRIVEQITSKIVISEVHGHVMAGNYNS